MSYEYLDNFATADIAFKASGKDEKDLFSSACDAVLNIMINDINSIEFKKEKFIAICEEDFEILLYKFLQELIYLKDSKRLFLRVKDIDINKNNNFYELSAKMAGEKINVRKHKLETDIKAITLHKFQITKTKDGFQSITVVDV